MNQMSTPETKLDEQDDQLYCYGHPKEPTRLRCTRCERPICGRCAIPASVGQHCPECVAEARKSAPKIRSAMGATAPATLTIIGIIVLFYFLQMLLGREVIETLALSPSFIDAGEWWRLMTPILVHGSLFHIFMNMFILYLYGPNVEQAFGTARFIVLFLLSGFLGSAFSYAFPPDNPSVGASGAIFGIVGVLGVYLYNRSGASSWPSTSAASSVSSCSTSCWASSSSSSTTSPTSVACSPASCSGSRSTGAKAPRRAPPSVCR